MNISSALSSIVLLLTGVWTVNPVLANTDADNVLTNKITQKRLVHTRAMLDENLNVLMQDYAEDMRLMAEANPTILGKQNAKDYFKQLFARFDIKKYSSDRVKFMPMQGYILDIGHFKLDMTNDAGDLRQLTGKYADLWRIQDNGSLNLITAAWNYDHWPAFIDELKFKTVESVRTSFGPQVPLVDSVSLEMEAYNLLNTSAVLQKDARILSGMFSEDGIRMPNYHPTIMGRNNIHPYWVKHVNELPIFESLDNSNDKLIDLGDHLIQYASHLAIYRSEGGSGVSTGKHLSIWSRADNGRLQRQFSISAYDN